MTLEPERLADVLAGARAGQGWALAALWRDLHPRLFRYLRSQEPSVAEDLASETWLGVARLAMGYPLVGVALLGTVWAVRRARTTQPTA